MDLAQALAIVQDVFGLSQPLPCRFKGRSIIQIWVNDSADRKNREATARKRLDQIEWQMVVLAVQDQTAYRTMNDNLPLPNPNGPSHLNVYGLAPIELIEPRPLSAYHATETQIAEQANGLRPSDGSNGYPDTEGKIHACATLDGTNTSAAYWAQLLAERKGLTVADYSILEVSREHLPPGARVYQDLHSQSGIVIDRVALIPIKRMFRRLDGGWVAD